MEDARWQPDQVLRGRELRVLVVDADVEPVLEVLYPLRVRGDMAVVGIAASGREAIRQAFTLRPHIVLIDPRLPDMDGMRVVEVIVRHLSTRVAIMSADTGPEALTRALLVGARGYLVKPLNPEEVFGALIGTGCGGWDTGHTRWGGADFSHVQAEEHARALLRALLTEEEYRQLITCGYMEVRSQSRAERIYRIPAAGGMVQMMEDGREVLRLCLQPETPLPGGDVILMHKLLLQADEEKYLRTANHFTPSGTPVACWARGRQ